MKSDAKFKEILSRGFKYDIRNLSNFHPTPLKSEHFLSMGVFVQRIQGLSYRNTDELPIMILNSDAKFE